MCRPNGPRRAFFLTINHLDMKRPVILTLLLSLAILMPSLAQKDHSQQAEKRYGMYAIAFYNQENLFDTIDDPLIHDEDFLPGSSYGWNGMKYRRKVRNMSTTLASIGVDKGLKYGAAVIGLAEVENRNVVVDLTKSDALRERGYRVLHFDSPDARGIDCAMLYNPRYFQLEDSLYVYYIYPEPGSNDWLGFRQDPVTHEITPRPLFGDVSHKTRGFLVGIGTMADEKMAIIVNHWPSRGVESWAREQAAAQVKRLTEALQLRYPGIKVVIMGDLNDDPDSPSMAKALGCKYATKDVKSSADIFNPWKYMLRKVGQGTLLYDGKWNLFDQIVITGNMVDHKTPLRKAKPKMSDLDVSGGLTFYFGEVIIRDYLITPSGRYKGSPLRTTSSGVWNDGYSDHFPTCIYLVKEIK